MGATVYQTTPAHDSAGTRTGPLTVQLDNSADEYVLATLNVIVHLNPGVDPGENAIVNGAVQPGWTFSEIDSGTSRRLVLTIRRGTIAPANNLPGNSFVAVEVHVTDTNADDFDLFGPFVNSIIGDYFFRTFVPVVTVTPVTPPAAPASTFISVLFDGTDYAEGFSGSINAQSGGVVVYTSGGGFQPDYEGTVESPVSGNPQQLRINVRRIGGWLPGSNQRIRWNMTDSQGGNVNNSQVTVPPTVQIATAPPAVDPVGVTVTIRPARFAPS